MIKDLGSVLELVVSALTDIYQTPSNHHASEFRTTANRRGGSDHLPKLLKGITAPLSAGQRSFELAHELLVFKGFMKVSAHECDGRGRRALIQ